MSISFKDIQETLPASSNVDSNIFSRLLNDSRTVASYKMYWLLGILDEVHLKNKTEIEFKELVARMITYAWYPVIQYKLSFGYSDSLYKPVSYIAQKYKFKSNCNEKQLIDFLITTQDKELQRMMKALTEHVPYRLISPFFTNELRGIDDRKKNEMIVELSQGNDGCFYKIVQGNRDKIVINENWREYLKENYRVIKAWIYYKLVCFIQKRNPNVPAIAFKLEAPKTRSLTTASKLWSKVIEKQNILDIYTGESFCETSYNRLGPLSIDHFIPWSFVLHDEMWNLVPTFRNINSSKSDNLLDYDRYISSFCGIQYKAFSYFCENKIEAALEDYMDALRLENPFEYYKYSSQNEFDMKLRQCISPLYQIAVNQGFEVFDRFGVMFDSDIEQ